MSAQYKRFSVPVFLSILFFSASGFGLEVLNSSGKTLDVQIVIHPTDSKSPCNARKGLQQVVPNLIDGKSYTMNENRTYLCSYDIKYALANSRDYMQCPAPYGYSSSYRVIISSAKQATCYAYPAG